MANKITTEEARELVLVPLGRKHPMRALIETMEMGELLHITREDFKWKGHTPMFFCNQIMKASKKRFTLMETGNKQGWVVERIA